MTEDEWLACTNPRELLNFLDPLRDIMDRTGRIDLSRPYRPLNHRKLRLFAVLCCRQFWALLIYKLSQEAVEAAERFADGLISRESMYQAANNADTPAVIAAYRAAGRRARIESTSVRAAKAASRCAGADVLNAAKFACSVAVRAATEQDRERALHCSWLHDLYGPIPFRSIASLEHAVLTWNDRTVPRIAEGIYVERAFERMPILHDALLDAGCTDESLLSHCRNPEGHVRGCWALDLILGKS
jgi:hypothetical protein